MKDKKLEDIVSKTMKELSSTQIGEILTKASSEIKELAEEKRKEINKNLKAMGVSKSFMTEQIKYYPEEQQYKVLGEAYDTLLYYRDEASGEGENVAEYILQKFREINRKEGFLKPKYARLLPVVEIFGTLADRVIALLSLYEATKLKKNPIVTPTRRQRMERRINASGERAEMIELIIRYEALNSSYLDYYANMQEYLSISSLIISALHIYDWLGVADKIKDSVTDGKEALLSLLAECEEDDKVGEYTIEEQRESLFALISVQKERLVYSMTNLKSYFKAIETWVEDNEMYLLPHSLREARNTYEGRIGHLLIKKKWKQKELSKVEALTEEQIRTAVFPEYTEIEPRQEEIKRIYGKISYYYGAERYGAEHRRK